MPRHLHTDDVLDEDNMASDSAVKVPSQQSVKAYVDTELKPVTPYGEGIQTRYPQLDDFYAKMENRITTPVDIMVVGDSVGVYGISGSWPLKLDQLLSDDDTVKYTDKLTITGKFEEVRFDKRTPEEVKTEAEAVKAKIQEEADKQMAEIDKIVTAVEPAISKQK